ncbi:MAG: hypothetical protein QXU32_12020 [Nitrososphaerales archaeon]
MNTFKVYKDGSRIRKVEIIGDGVDENDPILKALLSVVRAKGDSVIFTELEEVKAE